MHPSFRASRRPPRPRARKPRPARPAPRLEALEDRTVLSVVTPGARLLGAVHPAAGAAPSGGFSPSQIRRAYGFDQITFGAVKGDGAGQTIAVVDAYDQPHIAADLAAFDAAFGLPAPPALTKVNQNGGAAPPAADQAWGLEISLDVEWAHAIAPGARILLVEANSNNFADLAAAVNYARNQPGVSAVSMSWGAGEWGGETGYDAYFTTPAGHSGVTFVAASGDGGSAGSPLFPAVSPDVLAVGGTQLRADAAGNYLGETAWGGSGGGVSAYEAQPGYQKGVATQAGSHRGSPDVAYNASPGSPFAVHDTSSYGGWLLVGGTSAGAPQWAALIAIADQGRALAGQGPLDGASQTLSLLYRLPAADFHDVASGGNGGFAAGPGYDLVTGRGTPAANLVVAGLVGRPAVTASQIQAMSRAVLGRAARPDEVSQWTAVGATAGAAGVARGVVFSTDHYTALVSQLYQALLRRAADPAGLAAWVSRMRQGATLEQVIAGICASPEYYALNTRGAANPAAAFVSALYRDLPGRTPAPVVVQAWLPYLRQYGRGPLVAQFTGSYEFRTEQLRVFFGGRPAGAVPAPDILRRAVPPTAPELGRWVSSSLSLLDLEAAFLSGGEFLNAH
jgi:hypothetical protein